MTYTHWRGPDPPALGATPATRLVLIADEDAPSRARAALQQYRDDVSSDVHDRATLLLSEIVTNAVRFSQGAEVRLVLWRSAGSIGAVVADDGLGLDLAATQGTLADAGSHGGFGLPLVDTLARTWGSGSDDGSWVWFEVAPLLSAVPEPSAPKPRAAVGLDLLDLRMVVESVPHHALIALDPAGRITSWGAGAETLLGASTDDALGRPLYDFYVTGSPDAFARDLRVAGTDGWHCSELWLNAADDVAIWAEISLAPIHSRSSEHRGFSVLIADMTARKRNEDARETLIATLRTQALTDELTGLPNRRCWTHELHRQLSRAQRQETPFAIAVLDLNGFKDFNDEHGHLNGDAILKSIADSWSSELRASDMLARFGGDEFGVTLPDCPPEVAVSVVDRMQAGTEALIASSAGIATAAGHDTPANLFQRADTALYESKRNRRRISTAGTD